jgi:hypothetical protein
MTRSTASAPVLIDLAARQVIGLAHARGTRLFVTRGVLWITQEGVPGDVVLRAGDIWTVEADGLTVVEAHAGATAEVSGSGAGRLLHRTGAAPVPAPRPVATWLSAWFRAAERWFATASRGFTPYV